MAQRKSNIELLRLISMLFVLMLHANYYALGGVENIDNITSFLKVLSEQLCVIAVNTFVLISGWFGIKPNVKGGLAILFQVYFYHLLICCILIGVGEKVPLDVFLRGLYFGRPYWFVIAYLVLYVLSPILNSFIEKANARFQLSVLIIYFLFEFIYGWATNVAGYLSGYSAISFVGLYLLAAFIRRHSKQLICLKSSKSFVLYLLCSIIPVIIFYITGHKFNMLAYSSPFVILASVFFFQTFNNMKIEDSRFVNWMACSAFSIYLIHQHPMLCGYFIDLMNAMNDLLGAYIYVLFVLVFAVFFGIICILIDKVRILTWQQLCNSFLNKILYQINNKIDSIYSRLGY